MRIRAVRSATATATLVALALSACTTSHQPSATATGQRHDIVVASSVDITNLDKDGSPIDEAARVMENVLDRLVVMDRESHVVPALATKFTESANHLAWRFELRPGVKFSDGTPLSPADVVFSMKLAFKDQFSGSLFDTVSSITPDGAGAVVFNMKSADPILPKKLTLVLAGVIPDNYGGRTAKDFWAAPIGSGPFKVVSAKQGVGVRIEPNANYWGSKARVSSITYRATSDANARLLQLEGGQAQIMESATPQQIESIAGSTTVKAVTFPSTEINFITVRTNVAPFDDVHVRRAISLAIDRASIVKVALRGIGSPAPATVLPPSILDGYVPPDSMTFDPERAKQELAMSKYAGTPQLAATLMYISEYGPSWAAVAQLIQSNLAKVGFNLKVQNADMATFTKGSMLMGYNASSFQDSSETIGFYLGSDGFKTYLDQTEIKALYDAALVSGTDEKRMAIYRQIDDAFARNVNCIGLYTVPKVYLVSKNVQNLFALPGGQINFADLSIS